MLLPIGLYIAKSVIEAAGGDIWFESEENKGTTFYVKLPLSGMAAHKGSRRLDS
jgi:signal transduction histidine kinase